VDDAPYAFVVSVKMYGGGFRGRASPHFRLPSVSPILAITFLLLITASVKVISMRHETIDQRSLAFGQAIAARVKERPEMVADARAHIHRWLQECSPRLRPTLLEWLDLLNGPIEAVLFVLTDPGERATRLRQSNPFAGVLTNRERTEILLRFAPDDSSPT
jgi:hypothetical protein